MFLALKPEIVVDLEVFNAKNQVGEIDNNLTTAKYSKIEWDGSEYGEDGKANITENGVLNCQVC